MLRVRNLLGHTLDGIAHGDVGDVPHTAHNRRLIDAGQLELVEELAPPRAARVAGEGSELADLRARFDAAWARREGEHRETVDALRAELDAARAEASTLREQLAAAPKGGKKGAKPTDPTTETSTDAPTAPAKE